LAVKSNKKPIDSQSIQDRCESNSTKDFMEESSVDMTTIPLL